jgi:hypothetical protein
MSTLASAVLMVVPTTFGYDGQTAASNGFQKQTSLDIKTLRQRARQEYDDCVAKLRAAGITVISFDYGSKNDIPNAIFPNNWVTTWPDGRVYLYAMATESRRRERSLLAVEAVRKHFQVTSVLDLSKSEADNRFLEGTGVIVFDHKNKIAYGCQSLRLDPGLFNDHANTLGYTPILFNATDQSGRPVYHTNVLMGVQSSTAVICAEAIDPKDRQRILDRLASTSHQVIELTYQQMRAYCGNIIQLRGTDNQSVLLTSKSAWEAFTASQRALLGHANKVVNVSIPTIQAAGGGSVRCMVAEIFLQPLVNALA